MTYEQYYLNDVGFRLATTGYTPAAISGQLENVVLLHLFTNGYNVDIGKLNGLEIDFITQKTSIKFTFRFVQRWLTAKLSIVIMDHLKRFTTISQNWYFH